MTRPFIVRRRDVLAAGVAGAASTLLPAGAAATESAEVAAPATYAPRIVTAEGQRTIPFPLHPMTQVVASGDLPAAVSFFHSVTPPRSPGAPPHVHEHEDEVHIILEGTPHFLLGEEVGHAGPGDMVVLPRGAYHATWNEGDAAVVSYVFVSQHTRFEGFFDEVARRVLEEGAGDRAEVGRILAVTAREYGVTVDMAKTPERARPFFGL